VLTERNGKQTRGNKPWVSARQSLSRKIKKQTGRPVRWVGGVLFFLDTNQPVQGAKHIPKPERPVIGLKALQPTTKRI
jgi:hypothetical protein